MQDFSMPWPIIGSGFLVELRQPSHGGQKRAFVQIFSKEEVTLSANCENVLLCFIKVCFEDDILKEKVLSDCSENSSCGLYWNCF